MPTLPMPVERLGLDLRYSQMPSTKRLQMFLAMNRFKIALGREEDFIAVWKNRDSHLNDVPGFRSFNLLRGATTDEHTVFASHSIWESSAAFEAWTHSEAFRLAHRNAGDTKGIYLGHPQLELFDSVL